MELKNEKVLDNKRIIKNSLSLYFRMIVIMIVSLYTSRVYLQALGETDFGIFNIVGGIALVFSFLSYSMEGATQRYLNFEMGIQNGDGLKMVFSISLLLYSIISIAVVILGEAFGFYFLNTQMNIPDERMGAARLVFHLTLLGFVFQTLRIPFNAVVLANEKMSVYAYFSIIEAIVKLSAAIYVQYSNFDKLVCVSILTMIVYFLTTLFYVIYCNYNYSYTRYHLVWDKKKALELINFSSWNMCGAVANLGAKQGVDVILNIFWGVTINAAVGIATQVSAAINQLASNFQTAFNPQLVKMYAQKNMAEFYKLIFRSSKFSFFLMLYVFIPLFLCADYVLKIWLGSIPAYTITFVRLLLVYTLIDSAAAPLWLAVNAIGRVKGYQILISFLTLLNLPLVYIFMKLGLSPVWALIVRVFMNFLIYLVRASYIKRLVDFPLTRYLNSVVLILIMVLIVSFCFPLYVSHFYEGWMRLCIVFITSLLSSSVVIYIIGINSQERHLLLKTLKKIIK